MEGGYKNKVIIIISCYYLYFHVQQSMICTFTDPVCFQTKTLLGLTIGGRPYFSNSTKPLLGLIFWGCLIFGETGYVMKSGIFVLSLGNRTGSGRFIENKHNVAHLHFRCGFPPLQAVLEEADIRRKDVKKATVDFDREIIRTITKKKGSIIASNKVLRYMEDRIRSRDILKEKIRLKNDALKVQKKKMQLQLKQKEELGEALHEVDFQQLKIENAQFLEKIDERNQELLQLKMMVASTLQVLNFHRVRAKSIFPSLLCLCIYHISFYKVMLKILQGRLQQYMERELPDVQAGFRKGRGTRDQSANIRWIIKAAREFQKNIYFCFIGYSKAFDCVDHNKLWHVLGGLGIPSPLVCLLRNLYKDQVATVRIDHGTTDWFQIGKGVRQGCILLPFLFNLYAEYIMQHAGLEESKFLEETLTILGMQMIPL
uniref:Reverse transcriptase domain-containing protein n=1 Tax=Anolis carolinensis TaxID=28377 RepID=A0A803SLN7_ANOCA